MTSVFAGTVTRGSHYHKYPYRVLFVHIRNRDVPSTKQVIFGSKVPCATRNTCLPPSVHRFPLGSHLSQPSFPDPTHSIQCPRITSGDQRLRGHSCDRNIRRISHAACSREHTVWCAFITKIVNRAKKKRSQTESELGNQKDEGKGANGEMVGGGEGFLVVNGSYNGRT